MKSCYTTENNDNETMGCLLPNNSDFVYLSSHSSPQEHNSYLKICREFLYLEIHKICRDKNQIPQTNYLLAMCSGQFDKSLNHQTIAKPWL